MEGLIGLLINTELRMKKLFLCDIDGTIIDGARNMKKVSKKTIYAMKQLSKDNYVFIASGRCKGLLDDGILSLPVNGYILCNGAYCEIDGKEIFAEYFDHNAVKQIMDVTLINNGFYLLETLNHMFTNDLKSEQFIKFMKGWSQSMELFQERPSLSDKYHVAMVGFESEKDCKLMEKQLDGIVKVLRHNGFRSYDININGIDKGVATKKLMEYLNIDKDNTYCFGDGINDLEMLQAVGHPVIMANCDKALYKYNFEQTLDVIEDGFYDYLLRNNLIKPL